MTSYHDLDRQIEQLKRCELIKENEVKELCEKAIEILSAESNVKRISAPVQVCGDIHGQFYDLRELFLVGGQAPDVSYLFLGDYIDRGFYGVESFLLLLALKVRFPDRVTLLRGNHECRQVTHVYGFYDECIKKYGSTEVWKIFMDVCDCLALAAVIDDKIFCVHGGLSPLINTIGEIQGIDRKQEVPAGSSMSDLLWSDPEEITGWQASTRGTGYLFGRDVVEQFNLANGIDLICRAHQLVAEGYKWHFDGKLITVWSAPNYCYRCGNQGCILEIDDNHGVEVNVFEAAPQEDRPPFINQRIPDYFV